MKDSLGSDEGRRRDTCDPLFWELYKASEGSEIGLSFAHFSEALSAIGQRFLAPDADDRQTIQFYWKLHLKDLALTQACSRGTAAAWERFLSRYRERLYSAAMVIAKNDSMARELADSLSGDLFGTAESANPASSKLASYSGLGSLEGWLKAVLAHAYVDRFRSQRREISLDQRLAAIGAACLSQPAAQEGRLHYRTEAYATGRLHSAIEEACLARTPEQRFLLAAYFFDGWSLADIAKRLGVHESTVSRRMDRVLRDLRRDISAGLRRRGMSPRQIAESMESGVRELPFEMRGVLLRGIDLARY
jgi:RNA polymerase sigma-70 factor (ECF subfamily)